MKKTLLITACLLSGMIGLSQTPLPQPSEIANSVSSFWFGNNLPGLSAYATNLYSGTATNYLPAIMVSIFHDRVFYGRLVSASNKLSRVNARLQTTPASFPDGFKYHFSVINSMTCQSIEDVLAQGLNPDAITPEPHLIRADMGTFLIPDIAILYEAPALTLP